MPAFDIPPVPPSDFYPPPAGWFSDPLVVLRRRAVDMLLPAVTQAVEEAWRTELPEKRFPYCRRLVGAGVRAAVAGLSASAFSHREDYLCGFSSLAWQLPTYWEPATAPGEDELTPIELVAYRWAAAVIGLEVRNRLEDLHAKYTSDDGMPALNRGIRNAVLAVLIQDRVVGHLLSNNLAGFVYAAEYLAKGGMRIPATTGYTAKSLAFGDSAA